MYSHRHRYILTIPIKYSALELSCNIIIIKHETQCFITRWNTVNRVENTTWSGVFLTSFELYHRVLDITSLTKWFLKEKFRMQKWTVFDLISTRSININFLCISFMNYQLMGFRVGIRDQSHLLTECCRLEPSPKDNTITCKSFKNFNGNSFPGNIASQNWSDVSDYFQDSNDIWHEWKIKFLRFC